MNGTSICAKHWEFKDKPCPICAKEAWQKNWQEINNKLIEFETALKQVQSELAGITPSVTALAKMLEDDFK